MLDPEKTKARKRRYLDRKKMEQHDQATACPYCNRIRSSPASLERHKATCREKPTPARDYGPLPPVRCWDCGEEFPTAAELGQHRTRKHLGPQSFAACSLGAHHHCNLRRRS